MEVETAERRFNFKFENAVKARRHAGDCICFPCRVYLQYNDVPDEKLMSGKVNAAWKQVHDPKDEEMKKIMKREPDSWVIWNDFLFWVN